MLDFFLDMQQINKLLFHFKCVSINKWNGSKSKNGDIMSKLYYKVRNNKSLSLQQKMKLIISTTDDVKRVMKTGEMVAAQDFSSVTEVEPGDMLIYMVPTNKK